MAYIFLFSSFIKFPGYFQTQLYRETRLRTQSDGLLVMSDLRSAHKRSPLRLQAISAPLANELRSAYKRSPLRSEIIWASLLTEIKNKCQKV